MGEFSVGYGYDVHRFVEGKPLVLGGMSIDYPLGLDGHSDADVLSHAIVDALLGAANLGDIGDNYPPTDPKYGDMAGARFLELVSIKLTNNGYRIENIDSTIVCDEPIFRELKAEIATSIASTLRIESYLVSVKATTSDGLGFASGGRGIAAAAVVLISEVPSEDDESEAEEDFDESYEDD
jgi:2-C-methyl-D-erythritol 2,4-cyclodiphosphate synthase